MQTGVEGELPAFPTPEALWQATLPPRMPGATASPAVPFEDKGGYWQGRYYQDIAIERVLAALAEGRDRILLTLATGTGKTFIAFQLAWKLFHSRWNLSDWRFDRLSVNGTSEPTRRPRILFLADRNILADQAYNAFRPSLKTPWYASRRMRSRRRARCRRTAASSSRSFRPS